MEHDLNGRQVLRCPICGTEFTDIIAICPGCGNILDQMKLSPSLKAFISELDEYEKVSANTSKRFKEKLKLVVEKRKAGLIRDFVFDSDRKSVLEALIFIKSKVALEADRKVNKTNFYWIRLWTGRAEQLYEKARVLFRESDSVETVYAYIIETNVRIQKMIRRKIILGTVSFLILIVMAVFYKPLKKGSIGPETDENVVQTDFPQITGYGDKQIDKLADKEGSTGAVTHKLLKEGNKIKPLQLENFIFSIPDYWVENGSKEEYYQAYAETGGKVAMLAITYPHDNEEVSLEALYADNENMITAIESWFDECSVTRYEKFQSDFGVTGVVYHYTSKFDFGGVKYGASGMCLCFPSEKDSRWFFVVFIVTNNIEENYEEDFMEILSSIKEVEA
jgi:hypothetical protein